MKTKILATLLEAVRYFADPEACREFLAAARWPDGVTCPRTGCGSKKLWFIKTRGLWRCKSCNKQFSVKIGSIFENSPLGLDKWLPAVWMLTSSKKSVSSHRLAAAIGVTQKTSWFMLHRIRAAMKVGGNGAGSLFSGEVEADETFVGGKEKFKHESKKLHRGRGAVGKTIVMGLLERHGEGKKANPSRIKTKVVPDTSKEILQGEVRQQVKAGSAVFTDALVSYRGLDPDYVHQFVDHAETYVKDHIIHTNGLENFWSLFKRTIYGTHHFVMPWHLERYLDDATFRFNQRELTDGERFVLTLSQTDGRRLTYRDLTGQEESTL